MDLDKKLENMQAQINKFGTGHCLLVKLINYDELNSMFDYAQNVMIELYKIVQKACRIHHGGVFTQIEYNKVWVVLPLLDTQLLNLLAYEIYENAQLYIDDTLLEAYMNCHIGSINFPEVSNNAKEIYTLLITRLASFRKNCYYYAYDKNIHNINNIKQLNKKLNLLRRAVSNKKLKFDYQPIIDRKTGITHYYECLLRFPDAKNHLISIGSVICEAENKGLINIIDHVVLEMAVLELSDDLDTSLSINISNIGIADDNLLIYAEKLLKKHNVATRLIIEITETCINEDFNKTKSFLETLHKYGCRFALDDFGSGFTSFKQLQNLPIDIVKIDGSFIQSITNNEHSKYFVQVLIKMAEDLGVKTVAEFVANGEIAKCLIDIKIDSMQGNFFSPASSKRHSNKG